MLIFLFPPVVNSEYCDCNLTVGGFPIESLKACEFGIITLVHKWVEERVLIKRISFIGKNACNMATDQDKQHHLYNHQTQLQFYVFPLRFHGPLVS